MIDHWKRAVVGLTLALVIYVFALAMGCTEKKESIEGWEKDSVYNNLYDLTMKDKLKGTVLGIENLTPLPGMAPGVGLLVRSLKDGTVTVHLGPRSFIKLDSIWKIKGARVKVRGVWAEIDNQNVFIASKVKAENYVLKLRRTRDGRPHWTMSPEELAKERVFE